MNNTFSKNLPLLVGIFLPLIFILVLFLFIYLPTFLINPQYNFIYTMDDYVRYDKIFKMNYSVEGGRLTQNENLVEIGKNRDNSYTIENAPRIFLYNVKDETSHEIPFEEAARFNLDPGPSSPDGYSVGYQYGHNGIFELFGSRNENGFYISKGRNSRRLQGLQGGEYTYRNNFNLIGWVK